MAEVNLHWPLVRDRFHVFAYAASPLRVFPMPGGRWRMFFPQVPNRSRERRPPDLGEIERLVAERGRASPWSRTVTHPLRCSTPIRTSARRSPPASWRSPTGWCGRSRSPRRRSAGCATACFRSRWRCRRSSTVTSRGSHSCRTTTAAAHSRPGLVDPDGARSSRGTGSRMRPGCASGPGRCRRSTCWARPDTRCSCSPVGGRTGRACGTRSPASPPGRRSYERSSSIGMAAAIMAWWGTLACTPTGDTAHCAAGSCSCDPTATSRALRRWDRRTPSSGTWVAS
jgi:hypothetical protein